MIDDLVIGGRRILRSCSGAGGTVVRSGWTWISQYRFVLFAEFSIILLLMTWSQVGGEDWGAVLARAGQSAGAAGAGQYRFVLTAEFYYWWPVHRWEEKTDQLFWRGRDSRQERLDLVALAARQPHLRINASITAYFFFRDQEASTVFILETIEQKTKISEIYLPFIWVLFL
jgi:hypothetical protein